MTVLIVVLKLIPIVSGIALIAGGIGREFTRPPAERMTSAPSRHSLP